MNQYQDETRSAGLARVCTATRRDGQPCTRTAILGTVVCGQHGGCAPQVREAGAQRLVELQPLAIQRMREVLEGPSKEDQKNACPLCGHGIVNRELQVKVALATLDRTGMGPQAKLEVNVKDDTAWLEFATEDEAERLHAIMTACRDRMGNEIIEAEVVN